MKKPDLCLSHESRRRTERRKKINREGGNALLELAIVLPCLVVFFFGAVGLGIMLGRQVQVLQMCRDVAHMYSDGVDFSKAVNQNIVIQQLAAGTGMTSNANGVIILSKIMTVYQVDCDAAGLSGSCGNRGQPVFTQRIIMGDPTMRGSDFGTPGGTFDALGNLAPSDYLGNAATRASNFEAVMDDAVTRATGAAPTPPAQAQGEVVFVVECFFNYPDLHFLGQNSSGGAYSRFIYR